MSLKNRKYLIARFVLILAASLGMLDAAPAQAQSTVYRVAPDGATNGACGADWSNPCDLQYVLNTLPAQATGVEVWVKAGIYVPGENRTDTFELRNGVALYGGFAGTETTRAQRDLGFDFSILDGDIGAKWVISDNSYHVVSSYNTDSTAVLDGFRVTGGNGNDNKNGGGIYNSEGSPILRNLEIYNNTGSVGGGMYSYRGSPTLMNITFSANSAPSGGGGGLMNNASSPVLTNVTFMSNYAGAGGALTNHTDSSPILTNVTFWNNRATTAWGGAIENISNSSPVIRNTIFWDNTAKADGAQIYNYPGYGNSAPVISKSVVQGGCPTQSLCTDLITSDPMLGAQGYYGGNMLMLPLLPGSPAIDAGDGSVCPSTDQRGVTRPQDSHCDIGAYEHDGPPVTSTLPTWVPPTASSTPTVNTPTFAPTNSRTPTIPYTPSTSTSTPTRTPTRPSPIVIYVKWNAEGANNGTSWTNAYTDLQSALALAASGDEIWVAAGTYKPSAGTNRLSTFRLKSGVVLYGGFAGNETARGQRNLLTNVTVLSGDLNGDDVGFTNNVDNVYHVVTGASGATLDGFTITAGNADFEIVDGAGLYNTTSGLTLKNLIFTGNSANRNGGGMYNYGSNSTLLNVTFMNNSAREGGGLYNIYGSILRLTDVTFTGNAAAFDGGGMYNYGNSPMLVNVTFFNNSADRGGGLFHDTGSPALTNVSFTSNTARSGGGLYNWRNTSSIFRDVTFRGNSVTSDGGGLYNYNTNSTFLNVTFVDNSADGSGGAMMNNLSSPTFTDVTFTGNQASSGGGMKNYNGSHPNLTNVTFQGNSAQGGGAIFNTVNSNPALTNVTFIGNSSKVNGGAMYNDYSSPALTNVTFYANSASTLSSTNRGGGIYNLNSSPIIRNTIFWGNTSPSAGEQIYNTNSTYSVSVPVISNSVIQGGCPTDSTCSNIITADPLLGALGQYGGNTQTIPIQPGSSAIDTANDSVCPFTDQRGMPRPLGAHCDIGAFEYISSPSPTWLPDTSTPSATPNFQSPTPTATRTNTPPGTPTFTGTPISNCNAVYHDRLILSGNVMSMRITNQTGISLLVKDVFVIWDHDRGHSEGNDKTLRLQQASINGTAFWSGDEDGPSFVMMPNTVSIPSGASTISFTFHQTYDRSDGSERIQINLATQGCEAYSIDSDSIAMIPTGTSTATPDKAVIDVWVGGARVGSHSVGNGQATRVRYQAVNNGPVQLMSTNLRPIVGSQAVIYKVNGVNTSFSEVMGLPASQLDTTYWLPWYNNIDLNTQLRFANISSQSAMVRVFIDGTEVTGSPFTLAAGESTRKSFPGINNGPVKIVGTQTIVVSERVIYKVNGLNTSFAELMGLPENQLSNVYWMPWYNNVDMDTQLRFGNVGDQPATVRVFIGGVEMTGGPFTLQPGETIRKSFTGVSSGPVKIVSTHNIVASERVIYKANGMATSFSEMMGLPNDLLSTTFWLPWYNNVDLITQLRFGVP